jgi:tol-pal system protein YbgF
MNKIFTFLLLSTFAFNVYADEKLDKVLEEIQALNKDLKTLEKAVYSKSFATQSAGSSEGVPASLEGALTRQLVKLSELEEQIQRITAGHEETLFNLQKVSERLEKMQKDTELRFSELGVKSTVQSNSNNQQNSSANTSQVQAAPKQFPGTSKMQDFGKVMDSTSSNNLKSGEKQETRAISPAPVVKTATVSKEQMLPKGNPGEQYKFATDLIKIGDYEKAELALKEFVDKNPTHPLAGSAQYWFAETYYIRQLYHDAAAAYLDGYQKFPKSDKAPQNLLKLGITLAELGEKEQGCLMLVGVEKQYPKAEKSIIQKAKYETSKFKCKT